MARLQQQQKRLKQVDKCFVLVTLNSKATGNVLINQDFLKSVVVCELMDFFFVSIEKTIFMQKIIHSSSQIRIEVQFMSNNLEVIGLTLTRDRDNKILLLFPYFIFRGPIEIAVTLQKKLCTAWPVHKCKCRLNISSYNARVFCNIRNVFFIVKMPSLVS